MTMRGGSATAAAMLLALSGAAAAAQDNPSTVDQAGHIISQPGRDVGLVKQHVPPVLEKAADDPYATTGVASCAAIAAAVSDLDDALGPDFGHATTRKGSKLGTVAKFGGTAVVDSLIPFRGVVREVSGAAKSDRELAAAINAGYARRGFLRGLSVAQRCRPAL